MRNSIEGLQWSRLSCSILDTLSSFCHTLPLGVFPYICNRKESLMNRVTSSYPWMRIPHQKVISLFVTAILKEVPGRKDRRFINASTDDSVILLILVTP